MRVYHKRENEKYPIGTAFPIPLITVNLFYYRGIILDGKPFNEYVKSIDFYNTEDFEKFKKANNIKTN